MKEQLIQTSHVSEVRKTDPEILNDLLLVIKNSARTKNHAPSLLFYWLLFYENVLP